MDDAGRTARALLYSARKKPVSRQADKQSRRDATREKNGAA
jgi:hypothetical protein